uniref:Uncharacterized protein n=1 Tax=Aegilops tauschii subsp. strangulata TaxID=200361 RepID=A0A453QYI2_AEGTS
MNSYYYYLEDSRQWFWWSGGWRKTNDGRRYPAVNIVILTEVSFDYVFGRKPLTEPPQDSSPGTVISIKDMEEWQSRWDNSARYNKLLVYAFYDKNSTLSKAMDKLLEKLAKQYKGKADFCKLDVDNFEVQTQPDDSMHVSLFGSGRACLLQSIINRTCSFWRGFAEWRERIRRSCYSRRASRWARSSASRTTNSSGASSER